VLADQPAEQRTDREREGTDRGPHADRDRSLARRGEGGRDDRERRRCHQGGTEPLDGAGGDEDLDRAGQPAIRDAAVNTPMPIRNSRRRP
jgi:hypothetical protein